VGATGTFFATSRVEANSESTRSQRTASAAGEPGIPRVEILDLPESATLGDSFCHSGTEWRVMATRTGDRVLIARPISA